MAGPPIIEIREPGRPIRRVLLDRAIEFGREGTGEILADTGVSRRHLRIVPSPTALSLVDLGSRNGTFVNGISIQGRVRLQLGDVVRLGGTEIVVLSRSGMVPTAAARPTIVGRAVEAVVLPPPPAPAPVQAPPSPAATFVKRILGASPEPGRPLFPNFMELSSRVPLPVWHAVRVGSVLAYLTLCVTLFVDPGVGLFVFFGVIVPLLPILFFVAPGLWRNICPLSAANQTPRLLRFSRALTPPEWLRQRGYIIAITLFFGIAGARLALFNTSAAATATLLLLIILTALAGGVMFKGKSGWCSSICPLLPLQRVYGQTPFVTVPNSHCRPCVTCTKNCYDFKPRAAYQADMNDPDPGWSAPRKLFVAALPGFVLGFFTVLDQSELSLLQTYGQLGLFVLGSIGLAYAVDALLPLTPAMVSALWASIALNIFYWFSGATLADSFTTITGTAVPWLPGLISVAVLILSVIWIARTHVVQVQYAAEPAASAGPQLIPITPVTRAPSDQSAQAPEAEVCFAPDDKPINVEIGTSLLEVAERDGRPIEAGCRMGVCGADPVAVLDGMDCLSAPEEEELNTLRRLGLAKNTRMACSARLQSGTVRVCLTPEPGGDDLDEKPADFDATIVSVVVIGNGIAGVTAADFVRRGHPECEIHLIGQESHVLYNRMGISRLVYGRSAMQGLYLLPETWYDDHGITAWLNTLATRIDLDSQRVFLGTGDVVPYDRLILAMGSSSSLPPIERLGRPGSFVLRDASDAMRIRSYSQELGCRQAVVSGGGLLGLEAAYSLHELGLRVTVLERGARLMSKQIDARCSELVHEHFARIGMQVLYRAEAVALSGDERVSGVTLKDGRALRCEMFLAAVGIRPNVELAKAAGIAVGRGIVIDDRMQTQVRGVFAAGDVAEHDGRVLGLWPIGAKQAEVAAVNALGGDATLTAEIPATILKGVGLELFSIGRVEAKEDDEVVVVEDGSALSYRRMVLSGGRVVGAIVLGHHPDDVATATTAVKKRILVEDGTVQNLRAGNWSVLKDLLRRGPAPSSPTAAAAGRPSPRT
ncbi:MAG: FAD-dependent oxidoreductase [Pseudonocardia sp.]